MNEAKSELARAATHSFCPTDDARASSAASSDGTRRAFSQRRLVTRISAASSESGPWPLISASAASSRRPTSSETNISCLMRWSVASDSARVCTPRGGIIVCWSHSSS